MRSAPSRQAAVDVRDAFGGRRGANRGAAVTAGPLTVGRGYTHDTETPDIETASARYAARFSGEIGEWLLRQQTLAFERVLDAVGPRPLRVLELGGGHGHIVPLLLSRGHSVVVHGSAAQCFERIAPLIRLHPERLQPVVSSLPRLPFADAQFDLVVAVRLLGHVSRWETLLREMARVTRRHVIVEFARANGSVLRPFGDLLFALKRRLEGTTRPFFAYDERSVQIALKRCGMRTRVRAAQLALPMVLHRCGNSRRLSAALESGLRRVGFGDRWRSPVIMLAERTDHDIG